MTRKAGILASSLMLLAGPAAAQSAPQPACGAPGRSWVLVTEDADPRFVDALRGELASRGFDVCRDGGPTAPVARVAVTGASDAPSIAIEVRDAVTSKRLARDVDLVTIPADSRALTLALAADELLRASWAELTLATAPPPAQPIPPPVQQALETSLRPAPPASSSASSGEVGVVLAGEYFNGGQTQWGADARVAWRLPHGFATTFRLGLRSALTQQAPDGEVHASAILGGIGVALSLAASAKGGVGTFARFDVAQISYVAAARGDALASTGTALAALTSGGVDAWWSFLPTLRIRAELGVIAPLRPVRATDANVSVVGVSGVGALAGIGAGAVF